MVVVQRGDAAGHWAGDNVGSVEAAADAHLKDDNVDALADEELEGKEGQEAEEAGHRRKPDGGGLILENRAHRGEAEGGRVRAGGLGGGHCDAGTFVASNTSQQRQK